jgi:hypothetical protein
MALKLMRRRPDEFAHGIQLGGFVVDDIQPGNRRLAATRPPV